MFSEANGHWLVQAGVLCQEFAQPLSCFVVYHSVAGGGGTGLSKVSSFSACSTTSEYSFACRACWQGFHLPSFCLPDSFHFIFYQTSPILNSGLRDKQWTRIVLVVAMQFVSPWYDRHFTVGLNKFIELNIGRKCDTYTDIIKQEHYKQAKAYKSA